MKNIFFVFALAVALAVAAAAQQKPAPKGAKTAKPAARAMSGDQGAVMAVVKEFVHDFNTGNPGWTKLCADQAAIIDEFPPFAWSGANACNQWGDDYAADSKKNNVTDASVTLGHARHVDVSADRAYVVMPAEYDYKQNGTPVKEAGSTLTLALEKGAAGWRIASWAWTER